MDWIQPLQNTALYYSFVNNLMNCWLQAKQEISWAE